MCFAKNSNAVNICRKKNSVWCSLKRCIRAMYSARSPPPQYSSKSQYSSLRILTPKSRTIFTWLILLMIAISFFRFRLARGVFNDEAWIIFTARFSPVGVSARRTVPNMPWPSSLTKRISSFFFDGGESAFIFCGNSRRSFHETQKYQKEKRREPLNYSPCGKESSVIEERKASFSHTTKLEIG